LLIGHAVISKFFVIDNFFPELTDFFIQALIPVSYITIVPLRQVFPLLFRQIVGFFINRISGKLVAHEFVHMMGIGTKIPQKFSDIVDEEVDEETITAYPVDEKPCNLTEGQWDYLEEWNYGDRGYGNEGLDEELHAFREEIINHEELGEYSMPGNQT